MAGGSQLRLVIIHGESRPRLSIRVQSRCVGPRSRQGRSSALILLMKAYEEMILELRPTGQPGGGGSEGMEWMDEWIGRTRRVWACNIPDVI